jgi:hypothetical protein
MARALPLQRYRKLSIMLPSLKIFSTSEGEILANNFSHQALWQANPADQQQIGVT